MTTTGYPIRRLTSLGSYSFLRKPVNGLEALAVFVFGGQAGFVSDPPCFGGHFKGAGHFDRLIGSGDRGIDQYGVGAHFHGFGGVGRLHPVRHRRRRARFACSMMISMGGFGIDAAIGADGTGQRHHGRAANVLQFFGEDGVGVDIRQDDEAVFDEDSRRP